MKYAIARIGGKQLNLSEGEIFEIERQKDLRFEVIYFSDGDKILIGNPVLNEVRVQASLVEEKKGAKIGTGRFRAKSRYQKTKSHRQPLSVVKVEFIGLKDQIEVEPKVASEKKLVKPRARKAEVAISQPTVKISKVKKEKK